jgi:hypothetical protein
LLGNQQRAEPETAVASRIDYPSSLRFSNREKAAPVHQSAVVLAEPLGPPGVGSWARWAAGVIYVKPA